MDELHKSSDLMSQENSLLRARVRQLEAEVREYCKRLSWNASNNEMLAIGAVPSPCSKGAHGVQTNEYVFDLSQFGDLSGGLLFNRGQAGNNGRPQSKDSIPQRLSLLSRISLNSRVNTSAPARPNTSSPVDAGNDRVDSNGICRSTAPSVQAAYPSTESSIVATRETSTSLSSSASSNMHTDQLLSPSGTSPDPSSSSSPRWKHHHSSSWDTCGLHPTIESQKSFCVQPVVPFPANHKTSGNMEGPAEDSSVFGWPTRQDGGQFDPVLLGDWK